MKRLGLTVLLCAAWIAGATESALLSYLPAASDGAAGVSFDRIRQLPDVASQLQKKEVVQEFRSLGCEPDDVHELLYFTVSEPRVMNGVLVRISPRRDPAAVLSSAKIAFTESRIGDIPVFYLTSPRPPMPDAIARLAPDVYLVVGNKNNLPVLLKLPRGKSAVVAKQTALLPVKNSAAWFVDTRVKLPVPPKKNQKRDIRGDLRFCLDTPEKGGIVLYGTVACPDAQSASQMGLMIPLIESIVAGTVFGEDPELGQKVLASAAHRVQGGDFQLEVRWDRALLDAVKQYLQERNVLESVQSAGTLPAF